MVGRAEVGGLKITLAVVWGINYWETKTKIEKTSEEAGIGSLKPEMRVGVGGIRMMIIIIIPVNITLIRVTGAHVTEHLLCARHQSH